MDTITSFIPMDRRLALAQGGALPEHTTGAALFADIAGFTPLTEALATALGPQRGAEELIDLLNRVYGRLTAEIDRYRGSVISFSGDALTCWFDDNSFEFSALSSQFAPSDTQNSKLKTQNQAALRAVACALALQSAMAEFAAFPLPGGEAVALALKVAVACGPVRRFLLGDPRRQLIEVLAGATLDRLATAGQLAHQGEVVLAPHAAESLDAWVHVAEWRVDGAAEARYAVIAGMKALVDLWPWPALAPDAIDLDRARHWLLPIVCDRLLRGYDAFLTELRPAVLLFARFGGLDDDDPAAGARLDVYLRWVQEVLARYEGALLQVTIGDKGSYLYAAFGAPLAHTDDAARAIGAALELRSPPRPDSIDTRQIGIAGGRVRAGIYGGTTRTYGVQGDAVNLAARLMQAAAPGQILLEERLAPVVARRYATEPLAPIRVRGKREPVAVVAVTGARAVAIRLPEPRYTLPLVGREAALEQIEGHLARAIDGHGQIVGISAEAGMGKSRLVAEVIRRADKLGFVGYGGEAESYGTRSTYLAWRPIWRAFFGLDPAAPTPVQHATLEHELAAIDPALAPRLPLLGAVLDLPLPDNELTRSLDVRRRKESLEDLLVACLRARAGAGDRGGPALLLVLEDAQWLDSLSIDLLTAVGRVLENLPVLLALAYRPLDSEPAARLAVMALPHASEIRLGELTTAETEQLVVYKLAVLFGAGTQAPTALVKRISARAQGNPFYIEELLNYLQDHGIEPHDTAALARLDLPSSLASLILSRIDQLTAEQQTTLKVASIIGRVFAVDWLWGVHPDLGPAERVRHDLAILARLDLTPLESPEPELRYLFKHIMTQEVAYESLPFALRAQLHQQLAGWIERRLAADPSLDLLAFHYGRSPNQAKQREYYRRAGDAAAARYANAAAIDYYERLLGLIAGAERGEVLLGLAGVLERTGAWDAAEARYQEALRVTEATGAGRLRAQVWLALGTLKWGRGLYDESAAWLEQARVSFANLGDGASLVRVLNELGTLHRLQGSYVEARTVLEEALARAREQGDLWGMAHALFILGNVAGSVGDLIGARARYLENLALERELGNRPGVAAVLSNLGFNAYECGEYQRARELVAESLALFQELGARREMAISTLTLGQVTLAEGAAEAARALLAESLAVFQELGAKWETAIALVWLAEAMRAIDGTPGGVYRAVLVNAAAARLLESFGGALPPVHQSQANRTLAAAQSVLGEHTTAVAWAEGQALSPPAAVACALAAGQSIAVGT
ncbi:MAG: tetratricopeptide repeat protein [Roseiflexaceae bacterium]